MLIKRRTKSYVHSLLHIDNRNHFFPLTVWTKRVLLILKNIKNKIWRGKPKISRAMRYILWWRKWDPLILQSVLRKMYIWKASESNVKKCIQGKLQNTKNYIFCVHNYIFFVWILPRIVSKTNFRNSRLCWRNARNTFSVKFSIKGFQLRK